MSGIKAAQSRKDNAELEGPGKEGERQTRQWVYQALTCCPKLGSKSQSVEWSLRNVSEESMKLQ